MIRINLLPIRQEKRRETVQQQLLAFVGILILVGLACVGWWKMKDNDLQDKIKQVEAKKTEIKQLDKIIGEVNEFTAKKKELQSKLEVIQQLKKGKTGPVRALDDLATEIPKRVWLTKLMEAKGQLTLTGYAIDHEDVSAFMKALQKSKYFTNVNLAYSRTGDVSEGGVETYAFSITCTVNYAA
ncbi:MAG: PilN domain-containing protein [Deltaproteobacteria bacterium]|nr:PilN domain-containing protein [Deltaproteobacteria bacterium]